MGNLFYNLGRKLAPHLLKAKWIGSSLVGTESEKIAAERKMGCYLASAFESQVQVESDRRSMELIERVQARLAGRLRNHERCFRTRCMHYPELNALALPGGFIFISSSLLEFCEYRDAEVAFLMAHEMGHIVAGHASRRFLTDTVIRMLSTRAQVVSPVGRTVSAVLTKLVRQNYSQSQELEADLFAVQLVTSARYPVTAGAELFTRLSDRLESPSMLGAFFSSHPDFPERIAAMRAEIG